ncbi:hypothetical protein CEY12_06155 [Chryseobacterium sp. T16E-39]|uniref:hypothetical protein n=1 Tax=Chryseobacterium sp. T16E-39 TaxID=2015076 RepID=UPI000B5B1379|nr:hypothetical protein [Chryseobacterium sp. T16E-39]ASK29711.1 hypothetical protein CEY12_06155 [Chryseobacterium sp. T16E-39]
MKKIRIKQQNSFILGVIGALKTLMLGKGIRATHDINIVRGQNDSLIEFTRKDEQDINPLDFFMFGYFVGRDYDNH